MTCIFTRGSPPGTDLYLRVCLFTGCMILIMNCNLFKNTATELQSSHELSTADTQVKFTEQKDWLSRSASMAYHHDSANLDYSIRIWPKGVFSFSGEKGFTGEAEQVLVTGNSKTGSVSSDLRTSSQRDKGKIQQQLSTKKKDVADQKIKIKKSAPSWKWITAGLAFLGVICCFIYTKLKLFFNL
jgi:hypothetical protein